MASPAAKHFAKKTGKAIEDNEQAKKPITPSSDVAAADSEGKSETRKDSPAKRHFTQAAAKAEAAASAERGMDMAHANQYELMLMQLAEHKRRLKEIQSVERKADLKKELVGEYDAYIDGVIASGAGVQDDVLVTLLLWNIDAGNYDRALDIAEYALANQLKTPEQYKRDTATIVAEEIADNALKSDGAQVTLDDLVAAEALTADQDMPDEVRAKLHKAMGMVMYDTGLIDSALMHLERALKLNDKCGVKTLISQIEREKKKAETPSSN